MKAYYYENATGTEVEEHDIPAEYADQAEEYRAIMVETIAETDEELMEKFFAEEEISEEEYIETIASLYGNDVADEMNKSQIYITLKNKSGKVVKKSLPLKTLLTLKQSVKIGW